MSYVGTNSTFAAWANPAGGASDFAPIGSYAGKRQALRGSLDFLTGASLGQQAGAEVYKAADGHVYVLDLTSTASPSAQQLSAESAATIDDGCSLTGTTAITGAYYDYAGVYFTADLQNPVNSTYIYRLPGPDGVCNTADDVIHMVKTGMSETEAPITVSNVPIATVRTALGGISGFVIKSGSSLVLVDSGFANPIVLGAFAAPIGVAVALPVGTMQGYPTGQLYAVDGNIVYVDYAGHTVSASLYTVPNWTAYSAGATFAASPTSLYFAVNAAATATTAATASIYAMPANGSAAPNVVDTEPGKIEALSFPVLSTSLIYSVENPNYTLRSLSASGGVPATLTTTAGNGGYFVASATSVYYTDWTATYNSTTKVATRTGTQSGIVGVNGSAILAPVANSSFVNGGEDAPWPNDTTTTQTALVTVFQVQGLSPVSVTDTSTGEQYVYDGVSGGTLSAIDAGTNQSIAVLGALPVTSAMYLGGTVRGYGDTGFLQATNALSTQDPATQDLYLLNSQTAGSLTLVTGNL